MKPNEYILKKDYDTNIITKYGSYTNELKPKVIYLRSKAKITPAINKQSFEESIDLIKSDFLEYVNERIIKSKYIDNSYLSNIDISSKSVKYGKVSFLRYDLYLKPKVRNTLEKNQVIIEKLLKKFDIRLVKLLNKCNINCV